MLMAALIRIAALAPAQDIQPMPPTPPPMVNPGLPVPIPPAAQSNLDAVCFIALSEQAQQRRAAGQDAAETDRATGFYWSEFSRTVGGTQVETALRDAHAVVASRPNGLLPACWDSRARDFERLRRVLAGRSLDRD
jgi:hypothetical protein